MNQITFMSSVQHQSPPKRKAMTLLIILFVLMLIGNGFAYQVKIVSETHDLIDHSVILEVDTTGDLTNLTKAWDFNLLGLNNRNIININYWEEKTETITIQIPNYTKENCSKIQYDKNGYYCFDDEKNKYSCITDKECYQNKITSYTPNTTYKTSWNKISSLTPTKTSTITKVALPEKTFTKDTKKKIKITWQIPLKANEWGSSGTWKMNPEGWWDSNWTYQKQITINNNFYLTPEYRDLDGNFHVAIILDTNTLIDDGKMKADCSDIRIYDSYTGVVLNHGILASKCDRTNTEIVFELDRTITSLSTDSNIYIYYGNPAASNTNDVNSFYVGDFGTDPETFFANKNDGLTWSYSYVSGSNGESGKVVLTYTGQTPNGKSSFFAPADLSMFDINSKVLGAGKTLYMTFNYYTYLSSFTSLGDIYPLGTCLTLADATVDGSTSFPINYEYQDVPSSTNVFWDYNVLATVSATYSDENEVVKISKTGSSYDTNTYDVDYNLIKKTQSSAGIPNTPALWTRYVGGATDSIQHNIYQIKLFSQIQPTTNLGEEVSNIPEQITLNVYDSNTLTHLSNFRIDCNVNVYDQNADSPATIDMNDAVYDCNFLRTGYDSNYGIILNTVDSNIVNIYLTDSTPPTTSLIGATGLWQNTALSLTFSCTDGGSGCFLTQYKLNSGAWNNYVGAFTVSDGNNRLDYNSIDATGNIETTKISYAAQDQVKPVTTISGCTSGWHNSDQTIELSCSDSTSLCNITQYRLNGGAWNTYSGTFNLTTDLNHQIDYNSIDFAGNIEVTKTSYCAIDKTAPTTGTVFNVFEWFGSVFNVIVSSVDYFVSGKMFAKVRIDGGGWSDANEVDGNIYVPIDTDGNHLIELWIKDNANNDLNITTYAALDLSGPATSIISACSTTWNTTAQTFLLSCVDSLSGCADTSYRLNNGAWTDYTGVVNLPGDSNYKIDYNSTNGAGTVESMHTTYCAVDTTGPVIGTINTDANTGFKIYTNFINGTGKISATVNDTASGIYLCQYDLNQNGVSSWLTASDSNATHCVKEGIVIANASTYNFNLRAYNNATLLTTGTPTTTYTGDTLTPTTTINYTFPTPDTNRALIHLACTDAGSGCTTTSYRIDSGAWTPYTTDFNFNGVGQHTIDFNSTDNVGNIESTNTSDLNMPVYVTIKYPINEDTLIQITEKWRITITIGSSFYFTDLNADKNIYLPTGVLNQIKIVDVNGHYFSRTYGLIFNATDTNYVLQPYLVDTATGLLTTINTREATTNQPIPNLTFKIYKNMPGIGSTLVETIVTDSKGQGLVLLVLNANYDFNVFYGSTWIKNFPITATSSTIYFIIDLGTTTIPPTTQHVFTASWTPLPNLVKAYSGTQTFTQTLNNLGLDAISIVSTIQQNDLNLDANQTYSGSSSHTFTHTINWTSIGTLPIISRMTVTASDGNVYTFTQTYQINVSDSNTYGGTYNPLVGLQTGLRKDLGCEWNTATYYLTPCFPLFFVGLIICIALVIWASMLLGQFNGQAAGLIFLASMILFTFLTWIPVYVTAGLVLIMLAFLVNDKGGQ